LSTQARVIWDAETAVAVRPLGAAAHMGSALGAVDFDFGQPDVLRGGTDRRDRELDDW
jgi:hypothetical protein